jgi:hypothetical protein
MSNDCGGSRFAAVKRPSIARLNRKENRATTKATQHERNSVSTTAGIVTMAELRKCRVKLPCCQALR